MRVDSICILCMYAHPCTFFGAAVRPCVCAQRRQHGPSTSSCVCSSKHALPLLTFLRGVPTPRLSCFCCHACWVPLRRQREFLGCAPAPHPITIPLYTTFRCVLAGWQARCRPPCIAGALQAAMLFSIASHRLCAFISPVIDGTSSHTVRCTCRYLEGKLLILTSTKKRTKLVTSPAQTLLFV